MCQDIGVDVLCVSIGTSRLNHDGVAARGNAGVCAAFWHMYVQTLIPYRQYGNVHSSARLKNFVTQVH